jgi:serine/threonine-protein kinase
MQLRRSFGELVDLPAAERAAALEELRALHPGLVTQLAELFAAAEGGTTVGQVVGAAADALAAARSRDFSSLQAGPFRLAEQVGAGAMGVVYRAERSDGAFEQTVAVKLLPLLAGAGAAGTLFDTERRLLARLEHPYVARIIDGGALEEDGTPWLAMEFVHGVPLTHYCRDLGLDARIDLLLRVCEAVAHAHRLLIVHRDLKPSNILVTDEGIPRLLDFGVAALTDSSAAAQRTTGLTPAYASPEQLAGEEVTTASDSYALGVLLHEVLTGALPYDAPRDGDLATWHATKTDAAAGGRLAHAVTDQELRAIVQRTLAVRPEDRYASVDALAADLRAWRAGRPVAAVAGGQAYVLRKFLTRNTATSVTALGALALVIALTAVYVTREQAARAAAEQEAEKATQVATFLERLFEDVDPASSRGQEITAAQLLEKGEDRIEAEFSAYPDVRARLLGVIGRTWRGLGSFTQAAELHRRTLEALPPDADAADRAQAHFDLAFALMELRRIEEAREHQRAALALREQRFEGDAAPLAESYYETGYLAHAQRDLEEAGRLYEKAVAMYARLGDGFDRRRAAAMMDLAALRLQQGDAEEGVRLGEQALALQRSASGPVHPDLATALNNMGYLYGTSGRRELEIPLYREALAMRTQLFGADGPKTLVVAQNLAAALWAQGRTLAALDVSLGLRNTIAASPRRADYRMAYFDPDLTEMLNGAHEYAEAVRVGREILANLRSEDPGNEGTAARQHQLIAEALFASGQTEEALQEAELAATRFAPLAEGDTYLSRQQAKRRGRNAVLRSVLAHRLDPGAETRVAVEQDVQAYEQQFPDRTPEALLHLSWLGDVLARDGLAERSAGIGDVVIATAETVFAPDAIDAAAMRVRAAGWYLAAGRDADARTQVERGRADTLQAAAAAERDYQVVADLLDAASAIEDALRARSATPLPRTTKAG